MGPLMKSASLKPLFQFLRELIRLRSPTDPNLEIAHSKKHVESESLVWNAMIIQAHKNARMALTSVLLVTLSNLFAGSLSMVLLTLIPMTL